MLIQKLKFVFLSCLITITCAFISNAAFAQTQKLEKTKIHIAVGGKSLLYYLPLTIAEQLGFFKAEGLDVKISDFPGGSKALQALVGGSADVVSGAYEHTLLMQTKGINLASFVVQDRTPQIVFGVSNKTLPEYKTLLDLKGKKIGVTAPGSSTYMMANYVLAKAGLKPSDVSFIGVGSSAGAVTALRSGQIDAIVNVDPVISILQQNKEINIIKDTRTLQDTQSVYGGEMPGAVLYTSSLFIQKNPMTTQALTNAIVRALKWIQTTDPSVIVKTVPASYLMSNKTLYLAALKSVRDAFSVDGLMPTTGPTTALKMLSEFDKTIQESVNLKKINLSQTYTNDFAKKANVQFK